ncbi:MAG: hypothetical protein R2684_06290 [Pyrinomonadaceae bacterium]
MATYKDPVQCFAPLEVIERLLQIKDEFGFIEAIYLPDTLELAGFLDSYGFDSYSFAKDNEELDFGLYRSQLVPGGDKSRASAKAH